jgi:hypothetical protein
MESERRESSAERYSMIILSKVLLLTGSKNPLHSETHAGGCHRTNVERQYTFCETPYVV